MHTIKLTFTDGNESITRINGTSEEITDYYDTNNLHAWIAKEPQVKRIEYIESEYLKNYSSYVYLFVDYQGNGLLQ